MHYPCAFRIPATRLISAARQSFAAIKRAAPLVATLLLMGALAPAFAQQPRPGLHISVLRPSSVRPGTPLAHPQLAPRAMAHSGQNPVNTGAGIVYTCASNVDTATCNYLNSTVAGHFNDTFTNANANIYITYGNTGLGQSSYYYNFVTYNQYKSAVDGIANPSAIQTSAQTALADYDGAPYGSDYVWIQPALADALGISGQISGGATGTDVNGNSCSLPSAGCYNAIITITNDPSTPLYYDNLGGTEPANAYDFYSTVEHETDEVLGTSSCVGTVSGGSTLVDNCDSSTGDTGGPSVVDLFRYSSPGHLVLDSSLSTASGAYFSYDGGSSDGAKGLGASPKYYNALANGDDYADYVPSTPDCGTNEAIQDAEGCPGEDAGLTILNDGGSEINILTAIGYGVPVANTPAAITSPAANSVLNGPKVTFTWNAVTGATAYKLWIGRSPRTNSVYTSGPISATSDMPRNLPTNGETLYVTLVTDYNSTQVYSDYVYTAASQGALTSPAPGSVLAGPQVTFNWSASAGATSYRLWVGTTTGSENIYSTGLITTTSASPSVLPANGETLHVRLYTYFGSYEVHTDYTYTAATMAALSSPTPGTTLSGAQVTFNWSAVPHATAYKLWIGTAARTNTLYTSGATPGTSAKAKNLPTNAETLYVTLVTVYGSNQVYADYVYTASATP